MKKKNLWCLLAVLMVTIVSVSFVSCGDDDDEDDITIVGTWKYDFSSGYGLLTFNQNGTARYQEYDKGSWQIDESATYIYSNGSLVVTGYNGERVTIEVISLTKTTLILKDWPDGGANTFVRQ